MASQKNKYKKNKKKYDEDFMDKMNVHISNMANKVPNIHEPMVNWFAETLGLDYRIKSPRRSRKTSTISRKTSTKSRKTSPKSRKTSPKSRKTSPKK